MKKRTKKVLSFGVAALMAVSALPFSALSVSASIPTKQTENGGTPYNFLLEEQGSGVQTISISKDEIAAGDVTKTLDVFIDSEEWPDDNYLSSVKLNWVATKDATFADGGAIANSIYYQNVFNASTKVNQHDVTMPNGLAILLSSPYSGAFCMSPMFEEDEDLHTWSYNDAQSNGVVREIACDKIFGANLIANGDNKVKFEYDYYANADDYLADKNADKATHKSHKVQECDVKQKEDGTPYIEYSYINPGGEVAANYVEKTVTVDLPCYSTTRFVKDSDGNDCVPDINNYYSWGFIAASSDDRTYFVGGKSTDLRFTSFDVVVPKDTAEGTYYVQICSRNANKDLIPMPSAADFDSVKADQENYRATVGPLEDMSTAIQGKKDAATYSLPQDPSKAIVKIVVGDGTVTDTTTTAAETTTTENSTTAATTAATKAGEAANSATNAAKSATDAKALLDNVDGKYVTKTVYDSGIKVLSDSIALKVSQASFNALGIRVSSAESTISQPTTQISLKASQTDLTALGTRVSSAEAKITSEAINLTVKSQTETIAYSVTSALQNQIVETGIDITNKRITVKADTFRVQDTLGNAIAIFKTNTAGKPILKAENIDVDNLTAKKLDGAIGSFKKLTANNSNGEEAGSITFGDTANTKSSLNIDFATTWVGGDLYQQGYNSVEGRSWRFYASDIWCRGEFGHRVMTTLKFSSNIGGNFYAHIYNYGTDSTYHKYAQSGQPIDCVTLSGTGDYTLRICDSIANKMIVVINDSDYTKHVVHNHPNNSVINIPGWSFRIFITAGTPTMSNTQRVCNLYLM